MYKREKYLTLLTVLVGLGIISVGLGLIPLQLVMDNWFIILLGLLIGILFILSMGPDNVS